jgi:DNA processing protein
MASLKYWVWLAGLSGVRPGTRLALLDHFGTPEDLYFADEGEVLLTAGITREEAAALRERDLTGAERTLEACTRLGIRILTLQDADYPGRLSNIFDPPCLLYVRGTLPAVDEEAAVAVVGTRAATPYGLACAEKLGYGLAAGGALLVTGLARGIDSAAARGALRAGGRVLGVLGGGVDVIYPQENRYLFEDVAASGALLSEYAPGTEPAGSHFPVRNRIISGLSPGHRGGGGAGEERRPDHRGDGAGAGPGRLPSPDPSTRPRAGAATPDPGGRGPAVTDAWDILRDYEDRWPGKLTGGRARREMPQTPGYQARQEAARPAPKACPPPCRCPGTAQRSPTIRCAFSENPHGRAHAGGRPYRTDTAPRPAGAVGADHAGDSTAMCCTRRAIATPGTWTLSE